MRRMLVANENGFDRLGCPEEIAGYSSAFTGPSSSKRENRRHGYGEVPSRSNFLSFGKDGHGG